jgi:hypothetical protein
VRIGAWLPANDAVLFFFFLSLSSLLPPPLRASAPGWLPDSTAVSGSTASSHVTRQGGTDF